MIVRVVTHSPGASKVVLAEPDAFRSFHVEAPAGYPLANLAGITLGPEPETVWVEIEAVRRWAAPVANEWSDKFSEMIAAATGAGWLDDTGARIRAHVERSG